MGITPRSGESESRCDLPAVIVSGAHSVAGDSRDLDDPLGLFKVEAWFRGVVGFGGDVAVASSGNKAGTVLVVQRVFVAEVV